MISQCFWGLLPWTQIMHFFAICVLFSPDYIIYYCTSLLYHCQFRIMENITSGKLWPENMVLYIFNILYNIYEIFIYIYIILFRFWMIINVIIILDLWIH